MPAYNNTFFCDGTVSKCYVRKASTNWDGARQTCQALGGDLVVFETMGEQIMLETYFYQKTGATYDYWIGVYHPTTRNSPYIRISDNAQLFHRSPVSPEGSYPTYGKYAHW